MQKTKVVAIIDAFSTGKYLASELERHELASIHIQSRVDITDIFGATDSSGFSATVSFDGNMQWLLDCLKEFEVVSVSAGTDGVTFCNNAPEIQLAAEKIIGKTNRLGFENNQILAQTFLFGKAYVVNTVSYAGRHLVTDICCCHKKPVKGAGFVHDCEELLPAEGPIQQELKRYVFAALDALQVEHGPGHFEIMMTPDGPRIVEMDAKIQGGVNPYAQKFCLGKTQLEMTALMIADPDRFLKITDLDY